MNVSAALAIGYQNLVKRVANSLQGSMAVVGRIRQAVSSRSAPTNLIATASCSTILGMGEAGLESGAV